MNLQAIRESDILCAIGMDDLDNACAYLQGIAGIEDGGVAAMCFSDIYFNWKTADASEREEKIRHWLKTEEIY